MKAELVVQAIKNVMKRWHLPEGTILKSVDFTSFEGFR
jgi:hypothetical protein